MGSQRRANHADLCSERREYNYKTFFIHMHASRAIHELHCEFSRADIEVRHVEAVINLDEMQFRRAAKMNLRVHSFRYSERNCWN